MRDSRGLGSVRDHATIPAYESDEESSAWRGLHHPPHARPRHCTRRARARLRGARQCVRDFAATRDHSPHTSGSRCASSVAAACRWRRPRRGSCGTLAMAVRRFILRPRGRNLDTFVPQHVSISITRIFGAVVRMLRDKSRFVVEKRPTDSIRRAYAQLTRLAFDHGAKLRCRALRRGNVSTGNSS